MRPGDRKDIPHSGDHQVYTSSLDADEPTALAIVQAVSAATQRSPLDLEPLSMQIDPEALEDLVSGPVGQRDGLTVSFRFGGCTVVVEPSTIRITVGDETSV